MSCRRQRQVKWPHIRDYRRLMRWICVHIAGCSDCRQNIYYVRFDVCDAKHAGARIPRSLRRYITRGR